mmetsp:Transcript_11991/g.16264  ORF Transcript_11991/g.16264 Transcript_11991/m.16264 type:complete len:759 (-) Transcript_11991:180-2456(-)|eukprot:CAMPEP_0196573858 /NCGR_PEP_ID=MMETSP1081-20130531/3680_1 /TAXON_ID=36882 /ORGANISM="Pyramimonas amylifera, Strain CCMP720" /LENGTH=758 /DNA_ID=CAMNT_0041891697 /DNA_START=131 /DNA_END=2410 /DNA_ORIENTATION=-
MSDSTPVKGFTLSKRSRSGLSKIYNPLWYSWSKHYFEISLEGDAKYWKMRNSSTPETVKQKLCRRALKILTFRELDYRESVEIQQPYCLKIQDVKKNTLIVKCENDVEFKRLKAALTEALRTSDPSQPPIISHLQRAWNQADADGSGTLCKKEIKALLVEKNITMPQSKLEMQIAKYDQKMSGTLDFQEFIVMYKELSQNDQITLIMKKYCDMDSMKMDLNQMQKFYQTSQHQKDITTQEVKALVENVAGKQTQIQVDQFIFGVLLFSVNNTIMDPEKKKHQSHNMHHTLADYWISSSHNTYLTGNQLSSESSVHMYRLALESGCKCVELDCWDGKNGEPVVYHGHTLTSKIKFEDVIKTCQTHAFETSDYPLILSLENHCSVAQQNRMAEIMVKYLDEFIHRPPASEDKMPSPWELRRKILIKGKKLKKKAAEVATEEEFDEEEDEEDEKKDEDLVKDENVSAKLSELIYTGAGNKKKQLKLLKQSRHLLEGSQPSDIISLSEGKLKSTVGSNLEIATAVMKYHQRNFTRCYPGGSRMDSSNYDPMSDWALGAQVVALNFQTLDNSLRLNQALFNNNNRCGYVLKPESRRGPNPHIPKKNLEVVTHVLMGHKIPRSNREAKGDVINPFVKVALVGTGIFGSTSSEFKTDPVYDNGFNPTFNTTFKFGATDPDCEMLLVEVWDYEKTLSHSLIGYFAARLCDLREGVRMVPLRGRGGKMMALDENDIDAPGVLIRLEINELPEGTVVNRTTARTPNSK